MGRSKGYGNGDTASCDSTTLILKIKPQIAVASAKEAAKEMAFPIVTIGFIVAYAYVAKYSGQAATMGLALSSTGNAFGFFSPVIGWLGVFLTGSVTSANCFSVRFSK